jgi:hypothetical protein
MRFISVPSPSLASPSLASPSLASLALALALAGPAAALADSAAQTLPQITVTGEASVTVVPDLATVSLGVTTIGTTASEALTANSAALQAVMARLTAAGIDARDIQTSNLSLNPNYVSRDGDQVAQIQNYTASNTVTVIVRKIDQTGAVLDAAVKDGANTLNGLSFGLADPRPKEDAARQAAVADAKAKADLLATAAGVHLGPVMSIVEGGGVEPPMPMYKMAASAPVPVSGGTLDIAASVTMIWQLQP